MEWIAVRKACGSGSLTFRNHVSRANSKSPGLLECLQSGGQVPIIPAANGPVRDFPMRGPQGVHVSW